MTPTDPILALIAGEAKVRPCHVWFLWSALRDNPKADIGALALFNGMDRAHFDRILSILNSRDLLPQKAVRAKNEERGTRLPKDFQMPAEWLLEAQRKRKWTAGEALDESEQFICYWASKAGQGAIKVDWRLTWGNWYRRSARPDGTWSETDMSHEKKREIALERAALYRRMGRADEAEEIERRWGNVVPINSAPQSHRTAS